MSLKILITALLLMNSLSSMVDAAGSFKQMLPTNGDRFCVVTIETQGCQ